MNTVEFAVTLAAVVVAGVAPTITLAVYLSSRIDRIADRLTGVEVAIGRLDERVSAVEQRLGQVEIRLLRVEERLGGVEERLTEHAATPPRQAHA